MFDYVYAGRLIVLRVRTGCLCLLLLLLLFSSTFQRHSTAHWCVHGHVRCVRLGPWLRVEGPCLRRGRCYNLAGAHVVALFLAFHLLACYADTDLTAGRHATRDAGRRYMSVPVHTPRYVCLHTCSATPPRLGNSDGSVVLPDG